MSLVEQSLVELTGKNGSQESECRQMYLNILKAIYDKPTAISLFSMVKS